jgi:hypothetical protein
MDEAQYQPLGVVFNVSLSMKNNLANAKSRRIRAPAPLRAPRTKLGGILRKIRSDIVVSGAALLDWDALDREVAERRGNTNGEARG